MEDNIMFRYLEKYVGTYRVLSETDYESKDFIRDHYGLIEETFDELYIPCKRDSKIKHTYQPGVLCWYTDKLSMGRNVYKALLSKRSKPEIEYEETDEEVIISFNENDLQEIVRLVKPKTSGASIKPLSDKNLTECLNYVVPDKDLDKLYKVFKKVENKDINQIIKECIDNFFKDNKLKNKTVHTIQNIHEQGEWNNFIKYVKDNIK